MNKNWKYTDFFKPEEISISNIWDLYFKNIYPQVPKNSIQHEEMKRTFFAGFTECFKIMNDISTEFPEEKAATILDRFNTEAHSFFQEMMDKANLSSSDQTGPNTNLQD